MRVTPACDITLGKSVDRWLSFKLINVTKATLITEEVSLLSPRVRGFCAGKANVVDVSKI